MKLKKKLCQTLWETASFVKSGIEKRQLAALLQSSKKRFGEHL